MTTDTLEANDIETAQETTQQQFSQEAISELRSNLKPVEQLWCDAVLSGKDHTKATREAGYKTKYPSTLGHQIANRKRIKAYLKAIGNSKIVKQTEIVLPDKNTYAGKIYAFFDDKTLKATDRLRAAELLGKCLGYLIEDNRLAPSTMSMIKNEVNIFFAKDINKTLTQYSQPIDIKQLISSMSDNTSYVSNKNEGAAGGGGEAPSGGQDISITPLSKISPNSNILEESKVSSDQVVEQVKPVEEERPK